MKNRRFFVQQRTEKRCTGAAWYIPTVVTIIIIPISSIIAYYFAFSQVAEYQRIISKMEKYIPVLVAVRIAIFEDNFFSSQKEWLRLAYTGRVHVGAVLYKTITYMAMALIPHGVLWLQYDRARAYVPGEICKTSVQCLFFAGMCYLMCYLLRSGVLALSVCVGYFLACGFYYNVVSVPTIYFQTELWSLNYTVPYRAKFVLLAAVIMWLTGVYLNKLYLSSRRTRREKFIQLTAKE